MQKKDELMAQAGMQTVAVQEQRARQMAELNERRSRLRVGEGDVAGAAAMQILDESADHEKECVNMESHTHCTFAHVFMNSHFQFNSSTRRYT